MTLKYKIENQILRPVGPMRPTIELSRQVVYLELAFDAEWDGAAVTVLFEHSGLPEPVAVLWSGEPVAVPAECLVTGELRLGCVGLLADGTRLTTARMMRGIYVCVAGGAMLLANAAAETTPALWEQVLAAMGRLSDLNTTDKSTLVAAINEVLSKAGEGGGTIDPAAIAEAVEEYLYANPPTPGEPGPPGQAATIQITGADALPAGSAPTVTEQEDSTAQDRVYRLGIPAGKDGEPGQQGAAGGYYAPAVSQPDANTVRISYTPSKADMPAIDDMDVTLPDGAPGKDGYTPARGIDYWTTEDQQSIVSDVLAALPTWEGGDY